MQINKNKEKVTKVIITSHNLKATEAIEAHVNARLGKLDRFIPEVLSARVNLENDTSKLHIPCKCVVRLEIPGNDLIAEDSSQDMYTSIDNVAKKLAQQARRLHNKSKSDVKGSSNASDVERMVKEKAQAKEQ